MAPPLKVIKEGVTSHTRARFGTPRMLVATILAGSTFAPASDAAHLRAFCWTLGTPPKVPKAEFT
eukprot:2915365-Pyramimonas_sp.AAC.1